MAAKDLTHAELLIAFEARFDYLSARTMAAEAMQRAGVARKDAYGAADIAAIGKAIEQGVGASGASIVKAMGASPAQAAAPAPAEKPAEKAAPAEKAEAAPAAKADTAPAADAAPATDAAPAAEDDDKKGDKKKK